jgi:hypothetical protein
MKKSTPCHETGTRIHSYDGEEMISSPLLLAQIFTPRYDPWRGIKGKNHEKDSAPLTDGTP